MSSKIDLSVLQGFLGPTAPKAADVPTPGGTGIVLHRNAKAVIENDEADYGSDRAERARRERFALEFVRSGRNSVEAARRAGYRQPSLDGPRIVKNKRVQELIRVHTSAQLSILDATPERTIQEIASVAFRKATRVMGEDGRVKHPLELDPDTASAIKRIKQGPFGVEYEFEPKTPALEMLSRIHGLQKNVIEHQGSIEHKISARGLEDMTQAEIDELLGLVVTDGVEDAEVEDVPEGDVE